MIPTLLARFLEGDLLATLTAECFGKLHFLSTYKSLIRDDGVLNLLQHAVDYDFSLQQLKAIARETFYFPIGLRIIFAVSSNSFAQ